MRNPRLTLATLLVGVGMLNPFLVAQSSPPPLDARASDPLVMGWMAGAPPPPGKVVAFADGSWFRIPQTRWSFSHIRELMPTRVVSHGTGPASVFPRSERSDIDAVRFHPIGATESMTWEQSLAANYTDGILILHRGRIVYERYFGALVPERQHLAMSVTKSFVGTVAAVLISEGKLNETATVAQYVPSWRRAASAMPRFASCST